MKKTIAILLVLVIGMVGVWAAFPNAQLNLETNVAEFSEMLITADSTVPTWTPFENSLVGNSASYTSTTRHAINAYEVDAQDVGYLHTRTNRRGGYTVKITATPLTSTDGTTVQNANYQIFNAPASVPSPVIYQTGSTATPQTFVQEIVGTGMRVKSTPISVKLMTYGNDLSAGNYTADITFAYTGN